MQDVRTLNLQILTDLETSCANFGRKFIKYGLSSLALYCVVIKFVQNLHIHCNVCLDYVLIQCPFFGTFSTYIISIYFIISSSNNFLIYKLFTSSLGFY
jgi:hypothetical protein